MPTYYLSNATSGLSNAAQNRVLASQHAGGSAENIAVSGGGAAGTLIQFTTGIGVIPTGLLTTGNFIIELPIDGNGTGAQPTVRLARLNSGGTVQAVTASVTLPVPTAYPTVQTVTIEGSALGAFATNDRLAIQIFVHGSGLGTFYLNLSAGNGPNQEVITPSISTTYYLSNAPSGLSLGTHNKTIAQAGAGGAAGSFTIEGLSQTVVFVTPVGVPGITGRMGEFTIEVPYIDRQNNPIMELLRIDNDGAILATAGAFGPTSQVGSTLIYKVSNIDLGVWRHRDRLGVRFTPNEGTDYLVINLGAGDGANQEVIVPWGPLIPTSTYYLSTATSDISGGRVLARSGQGGSAGNISLVNGSGVVFWTATGDPGAAGVIGDITAEINLLTYYWDNNEGLHLVARAVRRHTNGTTDLGAGVILPTTGPGVKTVTLSTSNFAASWVSGDRLGIQVYSTGGTGTIALAAGDGVNQEVIVPWSSPNGKLKININGTWVEKPLKYYNGSTWVEKPLKYYNGSTWVSV